MHYLLQHHAVNDMQARLNDMQAKQSYAMTSVQTGFSAVARLYYKPLLT